MIFNLFYTYIIIYCWWTTYMYTAGQKFETTYKICEYSNKMLFKSPIHAFYLIFFFDK